jgi:hypothetical protein
MKRLGYPTRLSLDPPGGSVDEEVTYSTTGLIEYRTDE